MRRAIDSQTIRVRADAPVPATTAAGMRAHRHRATADTGRLRPVRRGALVINDTRFRDACEGIDQREIRRDLRLSRMRARGGSACWWALAMAGGVAVYFALWCAITRYPPI